ncbi:hypothetical protein JRQ81_010534 [Phrynocephalus forsythii]|uniref:Uncharacterized protein n=1 Tax=Phrynocephalus forsythii TaxID=171643 RepID=A0A9Q0Y0T4_9SAUR|nr:hypothetical protein JRQ81_010534 [Phrynocephalus forsythii]
MEFNFLQGSLKTCLGIRYCEEFYTEQASSDHAEHLKLYSQHVRNVQLLSTGFILKMIQVGCMH